MTPAVNTWLKHTLIGLCILFSGILLYEITRNYGAGTDGTAATEEASAQKPDSTDDNPVASLDDYAAIIERPLFSEDRRPYEPEVAEAAPDRPAGPVNTPVTKREEYSLSAVIISGDKRIALIETRNGKKIHRLREGEDLDGWTLTEVQPARVSLNKGGEVKDLELRVVPSGNQPVQQPAPQQEAVRAAVQPAGPNNGPADAAGATKDARPRMTLPKRSIPDTDDEAASAAAEQSQ